MHRSFFIREVWHARRNAHARGTALRGHRHARIIRAGNERHRGILHVRTLTLILLTAAASTVALAEPLLAPGDVTLRHDLQVLADAGIIRTPVTTWPISWPDIAREVQKETSGSSRAPIQASLARVRAAAERAARGGFSGVRAGVAGASEERPVRSFADTPREEAQASLGGSWLGSRFAIDLNVTAASNTHDDQTIRLDGSYAAATFGNWIAMAGAVDRWWGPGWEGSLILSNNARPIPGLALERKHAHPFRSSLLRWIGPWRATVAAGWLEGSDVAVRDARFFAARVAFRPSHWLEVGLSRTAQWCGEGRPCDLETLGNLLLGRDNRDASLPADREPGNQLAGYDLRLRSPWQPLPAALYVQLIGEDEAGGLPSKLMGLAGLEMWTDTRWGSARAYLEYADATCNFSRERPQFDCAYLNGLYPQGYRFRGETIGHSIGADSRMLALGLVLARPQGAGWSLRVRRLELDRPAPGQVGSTGEELRDLELQYNRAFAWGELGFGLGVDDVDRPASAGSSLRGFVQWRQGF
jgi:hypothetical protein